MSINPLQLAFYKGVGGKHGAMQFNPQKPHFFVKGKPHLKNYQGKFIPKDWLEQNPGLTTDELSTRDGAIFLDIASAVDKNKYDWQNKITMALSVTDLGKILLVLENFAPEAKIMHDPGAKSASAGKIQKYFNISSPKGIKVGCIVQVSEKHADGELKKHMVPLSADEVCVLRAAIRAFIPVALGWAH